MPSLIPPHAIHKQAEISLRLLGDLEAAVKQGQPLDHSLAHGYRRHKEFGSRDRRFFSALAFAWFRWRGWLINPESPDARDSVLAWLLDAHDLHPAIEHMAGSLTDLPSPLPILGTMTLHEKAQALGSWLHRPPPDINTLVPAWFSDTLFYPDGADRTAHRDHCLQAFQIRPPTWLRIRRDQEPEILERLNQQTLSATLHPRLLQAVCLPSGCNLETLKTLPEVEIQDLASQGVGQVCAPHPDEHWWDACAGSGGKSFHLADLLKGTGSVLATDTRASILKEFQRRRIRTRLYTITVHAWDGTPATAPGRMFDGVLVDAPCSGIGTWHRNPDARWRTPPEALSRHAALQADLLRLCAERVHPGGRLIYAVCTLTHIETTGIIETFLAERKEFHLDPTPHPLTGYPTGGNIWIWPWEGNCNGMFMARMRKVE